MTEIKEIADNADMIINGYAFTSKNNGFRIINLNNPKRAAFINKEGNVLETSMDDIELSIINTYFEKNKQLLEE